MKQLRALNRNLTRALDQEANCSDALPEDAALLQVMGKLAADDGAEEGVEQEGDALQMQAIETKLATLGTNMSHTVACLRCARAACCAVSVACCLLCLSLSLSLSLSRARARARARALLINSCVAT